VKFCPKCERRMKPRIEEGIVSCPKCGLSYDREEENVRVNGNVLWNPDTFHASSLNIMEVERGLEALPTTAIECPRCRNNIAFWWMLQTRSADEPATQFYRCTKCTHTWRNYS
jgi:DNA-directed RNA polymerase subunit M